MTPTDTPEGPANAPDILQAMRRCGLIGADETPALVPLTGGVSSDIFRVERERGWFCVKRALPKLRVKDDWHAPVERNSYEARWMRIAAEIVPASVPKLLGEDRQAGMFAMSYLEPSRYPEWKGQLLEGQVSHAMASEVGETLARIHAATAGRQDYAEAFETDPSFWALRLEAYFVAAGRRNADVSSELDRLAETTLRTKLTLVHGDISPKNILSGPEGPVFLDAECAWYGDPAFDLAFCLNHQLLKCLWRPGAAPDYLDAFSALHQRYVERIDWEAPADLEARAARLLPGLMLARIDGKSPVEYVHETAEKDRVRRVSKPLLRAPAERLGEVRAIWEKELQR